MTPAQGCHSDNVATNLQGEGTDDATVEHLEEYYSMERQALSHLLDTKMQQKHRTMNQKSNIHQLW